MTVVLVPRGVAEYQGKPVWVYAQCESEIVAYVCLSCHADFPTRAHFAMHEKELPDTEHLVVRHCHQHGLEAIRAKQPAGDRSDAA